MPIRAGGVSGGQRRPRASAPQEAKDITAISTRAYNTNVCFRCNAIVMLSVAMPIEEPR